MGGFQHTALAFFVVQGSVLALCCSVVVSGAFHAGSLSDPVCVALGNE